MFLIIFVCQNKSSNQGVLICISRLAAIQKNVLFIFIKEYEC